MKLNRVTALLLSLTLAFSLAACGQGASSASTASSSAASSAAAETKTEEQLLAEENEILPQTMPCGRRCSPPWTKT